MKHHILTDRQISALETVGTTPFLAENFYLTGGTPLAAFYLHHRYSEDLDFFSEQEIDMLNLNIALKRVREVLHPQTVDFQQSYNRNLFFLHFKEEVLKVEFTYFPFPRMEKGSTEYGVVIDSLLDIAINKLFTIYQRTAARDYIDLYSLCKQEGYTVQDLIAKAKVKFDWHIDPLQLGTQFIKAEEAKDYPRLITDIQPEAWQSFFIEEAKKLKQDIFE